MTFVSVREAALGRWKGILSALGVDSRFLTGKNGPCPQCGGKDRFRFDDKEGRGSWICSRCGAGDGIQLAMAVTGLGFKDAADRVQELVGGIAPTAPRPVKTEAEHRADMTTLWRAARLVDAGDPVSHWLMLRAGVVTPPAVLRTVSDPIWTRGRVAMLAKVSDPAGAPVQIHRTLVTKDGRGAERLMMPGTVPKGSAVRLFPPDAEMGIAEGIETAFAAAALFGIPCWAGLNAGLMGAWVPPPEARRIVIFGDNDASFTGQAAAYALARRLASDKLAVEVRLPPGIDTDWNDVWRERNEATE